MNEPLTRRALSDFFHSLGVQTGAKLIVHSSLRSLGAVEGGADTVIDALLACIGHEGLLMVPTFTYRNDVFDPAVTPSRTGQLTEAARNREAAIRSLHPTHSVAALGAQAAAFCDGHHRLPGLGIDSPLDRLAQAGGGVLLLGVGHVSNSTVHVGEAYARAPYLDIPFDPDAPRQMTVKGLPNTEVNVVDSPGCSRAFGTIEAGLRQDDAIRDSKVGKALVQWMKGEAVISRTVQLLQQDATALLCRDHACYRCRSARERIG